MDAGVVSNFRPQAFAARTAAESRAGPSAASPLLPDAQRHRLRRGALHPTPRRSQRRLTPFFCSLLGHAGDVDIAVLRATLSPPAARSIAHPPVNSLTNAGCPRFSV